jgi:phage tail sheath protein FI
MYAGRKAQRRVVVAAMKSAIDANTDIREEQRQFNLLAAPGYPELIANMATLNVDRKETAHIIADSPLRLAANAANLQTWSKNSNAATDNGEDGLVTNNAYMSVYYPSGYSSDLAGNSIVVPASHMILRTMAYNDSVGYQWFAAAGTNRGKISNATAIGYIDSATSEFQSIAVREGLRDVLYADRINPITFINGSGLMNFGNKSRASTSSAIDRVNVSRLVSYMRRQLDLMSKPFIFEPNDELTRNEIKGVIESFCNELMAKRALSDYLVVCDESNNTSTRIDRNELYVDVAIEPVKALEFIYIPVRLKNTGEIAKL